MKGSLRFGVVLLSMIAALSWGTAFAANETGSSTAVNNSANISASDMKEIQSIAKDLLIITSQLDDITKQLLLASELQNATQIQNNTTNLQNATLQLKNATQQLQTATNPFANAKGNKPKSI
jgi:hypothetical protein